jgi:hypothetical protein
MANCERPARIREASALSAASVRLRVVLSEHVAAEVVLGVAPHGVDVIASPLRVVVLDQEPRPLQPVVVRLARLDAACPGEMQAIQSAVIEFPCLGRGELLRHAPEVLADEV